MGGEADLNDSLKDIRGDRREGLHHVDVLSNELHHIDRCARKKRSRVLYNN